MVPRARLVRASPARPSSARSIHCRPGGSGQPPRSSGTASPWLLRTPPAPTRYWEAPHCPTSRNLSGSPETHSVVQIEIRCVNTDAPHPGVSGLVGRMVRAVVRVGSAADAVVAKADGLIVLAVSVVAVFAPDLARGAAPHRRAAADTDERHPPFETSCEIRAARPRQGTQWTLGSASVELSAPARARVEATVTPRPS